VTAKEITTDFSLFREHQRPDLHIDLPYSSVVDLFDRTAVKSPEKIFIISPGTTTEQYTYREFREFTVTAMHYLEQHGLVPGDRINLVIPNSVEFLILYFAAFRAGLTVVPINQDLAPEEVLFIIRNCGSKMVLVDSLYAFKLEKVEGQLEGIPVKALDKMPGFEPVSKVTVTEPDTRRHVPALHHEAVIIYTSGTTGNPKGVVLNHLNLLSDAGAIAGWFDFNSGTRTLCILPLFHNNGQVVTLLAPLYAGGSTVIIKGKTSLLSFWGLINEYQCTWTSVMPSILSILLNLGPRRKDSTMKGIICGGQVLKPAVQAAFEEMFSVPVFEGFGLTETTSFSCFNPYPAGERIAGSIGKPLPVNEMKIVDDDDNEMAAMADGEICIRGFNVATEYLGLPDRNAVSFRNGWFHSGDYGYRDDNNCYFFKERKDSLIIKGGENIYPAELENVLYQHPGVAECAVIGIPDKLLGEEICAFVRLKDETAITETELMKFCQDKIANFKLAKKIIIINRLGDLTEIPKGPTQKILYRKLKEYYQIKFNS
jgi:acyl-CoA synthetase (AMP-forming)/AMP-acid ligase II